MKQICFPGMERPDGPKKRELSKQAAALMQYLQGVHRINGWLAPSIDFLCRKFGRSRASVCRWMKELRDGGCLKTKQRGRKSALFSLVRRLGETARRLLLITESTNELSSRFAKKPPKKSAVSDFTEEDWADFERTARRWSGVCA